MRRIRLSETALRRVVSEAVRRVLSEQHWDDRMSSYTPGNEYWDSMTDAQRNEVYRVMDPDYDIRWHREDTADEASPVMYVPDEDDVDMVRADIARLSDAGLRELVSDEFKEVLNNPMFV